jgi:hypothetical protein
MRAPRRASLEECIRENNKEFLASGEQTALAYDDCCSSSVTPRVTKAIKAIILVDQVKADQDSQRMN